MQGHAGVTDTAWLAVLFQIPASLSLVTKATVSWPAAAPRKISPTEGSVGRWREPQMVANVEDTSKQLWMFEGAIVHVPGSGRQGLCSPCPRSPRRRCCRLQRDLNRIQGRVELFAYVCVFLLPRGRLGVGEHCLLTGAKDGVFGTCSLKLLSILFCWGIHRGRRRDWHRAARLAGLKFGWLGALEDTGRSTACVGVSTSWRGTYTCWDASESVGLRACQPARYKSG